MAIKIPDCSRESSHRLVTVRKKGRRSRLYSSTLRQGGGVDAVGGKNPTLKPGFMDEATASSGIASFCRPKALRPYYLPWRWSQLLHLAAASRVQNTCVSVLEPFKLCRSYTELRPLADCLTK